MKRRDNPQGLRRIVDATAIVTLLVAVVLSAWTARAQADGGTAQFTKSDGPFRITVFTSPSPLRAGPVDISLMIQNQENQQPLLACSVDVQLRRDTTCISAPATRDAAQNRLLYAAQVKIPEPGIWDVAVVIKNGTDSAKIIGAITVAPARSVLLAYWRSLLLPPLLIALFVLNQWLKRNSAKRPR